MYRRSHLKSLHLFKMSTFKIEEVNGHAVPIAGSVCHAWAVFQDSTSRHILSSYQMELRAKWAWGSNLVNCSGISIFRVFPLRPNARMISLKEKAIISSNSSLWRFQSIEHIVGLDNPLLAHENQLMKTSCLLYIVGSGSILIHNQKQRNTQSIWTLHQSEEMNWRKAIEPNAKGNKYKLSFFLGYKHASLHAYNIS